jgi:hypothetical protein
VKGYVKLFGKRENSQYCCEKRKPVREKYLSSEVPSFLICYRIGRLCSVFEKCSKRNRESGSAWTPNPFL